jgi:hypothetical protein
VFVAPGVYLVVAGKVLPAMLANTGVAITARIRAIAQQFVIRFFFMVPPLGFVTFTNQRYIVSLSI